VTRLGNSKSMISKIVKQPNLNTSSYHFFAL